MKRLLDRRDEKIITELKKNGRMTHAELATKVNLSRNAVRQRVGRLERDGVIQRYTIVVGEGSRPEQLATAILFVYRHDRMRGGDVIQALRQIPEIVRCDIMSGEFDLVLRVETPDVDRVRTIWNQISGLPGVRDTLTAFALSSVISR